MPEANPNDIVFQREQASISPDFKDNQFSRLFPNDLKRSKIQGELPQARVLQSKLKLAMIAEQLGAPDVADKWAAEVVSELGLAASNKGWLTEEQNTGRMFTFTNAPPLPLQPQQQQQVPPR